MRRRSLARRPAARRSSETTTRDTCGRNLRTGDNTIRAPALPVQRRRPGDFSCTVTDWGCVVKEGGVLTATSATGQRAVELEIADTGASLSDEERQQAFELLPTAQRGGTGWGLAVVHRIAEVHGGSVTAANCPEGGVAFTLRIPRPAALEAAA